MGKGAPVLVHYKTVDLVNVKPKKASDCFTGKLWSYRDVEIDIDLTNEQIADAFNAVGVYMLHDPPGTSFREMSRAAVQAVSESSDKEIILRLKERRLTLTLQEVDSLVERQECGEDVGIHDDGFLNFAFVEDAKGSVSVLSFYRRNRQWEINDIPLALSDRWHAGYRLLLRNTEIPVL